MNKFLKILGFLWLLPMTILVWLFYVFPLWVSGQIKYGGKVDFLIAGFVLVEKNNWYSRAWDHWAGWSGPCVLVLNIRHSNVKRIISHELRHCDQQFVFGWTHYILYAIVFVLLWAFTNKNPYLDHPFEIDARKHESK